MKVILTLQGLSLTFPISFLVLPRRRPVGLSYFKCESTLAMGNATEKYMTNLGITPPNTTLVRCIFKFGGKMEYGDNR
jgi:hypothetical protein